MLKMTDNKLQDWLERCKWGRLESEIYKTPEIEMSELKVALGG
jgi:hypothetical protein